MSVLLIFCLIEERGYAIAYLLDIFMAHSYINNKAQRSSILRCVYKAAIAKCIRGTVRKKRTSEVIGVTG